MFRVIRGKFSFVRSQCRYLAMESRYAQQVPPPPPPGKYTALVRGVVIFTGIAVLSWVCLKPWQGYDPSSEKTLVEQMIEANRAQQLPVNNNTDNCDNGADNQVAVKK